MNSGCNASNFRCKVLDFGENLLIIALGATLVLQRLQKHKASEALHNSDCSLLYIKWLSGARSCGPLHNASHTNPMWFSGVRLCGPLRDASHTNPAAQWSIISRSLVVQTVQERFPRMLWERVSCCACMQGAKWPTNLLSSSAMPRLCVGNRMPAVASKKEEMWTGCTYRK